MTSEPKSPEQGTRTPEEAPNAPSGRRQYTAPHVKCLGSVRDLTLGSPTGLLMDGLPGGKRAAM